MQRQIFQFSYDTGDGTAAIADTGPPFSGTIAQVRWNPSDGDTGGDLELSLLPTDADTGVAWVFFNDTDCLGADFTVVPTQQSHTSTGAVVDTGHDFPSPIVGHGDRLRVRVTPGRDVGIGNLYVWIK